MAIAISKAIGIDDTVKRFDEIRVKLKSQKLKRVKLTQHQVQEPWSNYGKHTVESYEEEEWAESIKSQELKFQREHSV